MIRHPYKILYLFALYTTCSIGQNKAVADTIQNRTLHEVIVTSQSTSNNLHQQKPLLSVDDYLSKQENISLIRRGAYAWEPMINNMAIERTRQTIDGMQVFYACTDKMDPITSYVEMNNLESIEVTSGAQGSHFGSTLGGSIDLKTKKLSFTDKNEFKAKVQTGFESVSKQKIIGGNFDYTTKKFYVNGTVMFRDADNYKAGGNKEIQNSQFRKLNASGIVGYKLNDTNTIEAAVIYDKATDIGYPALPMDVSLAEALITSVKHSYTPTNSWITQWETKLYYNTITHRMDDTNRPDVNIRMLMPGWTDTFGGYSMAKATLGNNHHLSATLNAYHNKSLATMTMLSNDPKRKDMFAYTWPDVKTFYVGGTLKDHWQINDKQSFVLSASIGSNYNTLSQAGVDQLGIFHNDDSFKDHKERLVGNLAANYEYINNEWSYGVGLGYGNRAPSVSEGYGYYLFNSGDKYDYIGNPNLKNESSYEGNLFVKYATPAFSSKISGSAFYLSNYIIGVITPPFNAMTEGGLGLKVYNNIDYAIQATLDWSFTYKVDGNWKLTGGASYNYGKDKYKHTLPFISPLAYRAAVDYKHHDFSTQLNVRGNAVKSDAALFYGETTTPAFAILGWNANYEFFIKSNSLNISVGIENILDTYYSTYADWNKIPNPGRNFFVNLAYKL